MLNLFNFKDKRIKLILLAAAVVLLIAFPSFLPSFYVFLGTKILFLGLAAMSLVLIYGYGGMLSFAQVGFLGITGYIIGIMTVSHGMDYGVAVLLAVVVSVGIGAGFGLVAIRTRGNYFLMMTLAFGQLLYLAALQWVEVTGGFNGITGIAVPSIFGFSQKDSNVIYYLVLAVVGACFLLLKRIVVSPYGLALQGARDNEKKLAALGYNAQMIRLIVVILSALFASIAGVLSTTFYSMIAPDMLNLSVSVTILFMVLIGGSKKFEGALLGSLIFIILQDVTSQYTERYNTIIGICFIIVVLFMPNGILGLKFRDKRKLTAR